MSLFSISLSLFLLMDPIGNVPLFIAILKEVDPKKQRKIIIRELIIAFFAILLFYLVGDALLSLLHISQQSVLISGGIILFLIAIKMIFPRSNHEKKVQIHEKPFIVPLAIPLVAGPAVLATVMIYSRQEIATLTVIGGIFLAWIFSTIILLFSPILQKALGNKGIIACERLMGLLLTMIAVQMFLDGYSHFFTRSIA
ncbi:MAG: NAAT family transporter [Chlamydiae bacterium]|nr:NAAT family transporter [Chlamydiota bacterium]